MRYSPSVRGTIKTAVGLIITGVLWLSLSAATTETVPLPRGSAQQLEGVRARNWSEWPWSVGGQTSNLADHCEGDSAYELTSHSGLEWEVKTQNQDWLNLNRGDNSKGSVRTSIVRF